MRRERNIAFSMFMEHCDDKFVDRCDEKCVAHCDDKGHGAFFLTKAWSIVMTRVTEHCDE